MGDLKPVLVKDLLILSIVLTVTLISVVRGILPSLGIPLCKLGIGKTEAGLRHHPVRNMVFSHHAAVHQKIGITACPFLHPIIGSGVQPVPLSIYLHIIPHVQVLASVRILKHALHQYTGNAQRIQDGFDRPGIALAQAFPFYQRPIGCPDMPPVA